MSFTIYVNTVDKSSYVTKNSMRITKKAGNQSNLDISFNCRQTDWMPGLGQTIEVYDGLTALFGGIISRLSKQSMEPATSSAAYTQVSVNSNGYNNIAARRTINAYYTNQTAGFIFENIVDTVLNDVAYYEGIQKGTFTAGQTFAKYGAVCKSVKEIFDDLAKQSGCQWYINDARTIYFESDSTPATAEHTLDSSGAFTLYQITGQEESLENYCNKVFIKFSEGIYTYVSDTSEITLRASADGTAWSSGVYGKVIQAGNTDTATALSTIGDNELKKYGFAPVSLKIRSNTSTWTVGTQIQVYQPKYGITADTQFLIEELNISVQDNLPTYDMTLTKCNSANVSTQKHDRAKEFFETLISRSELVPTAGIDTGATNIIDNYQVTTTADLTNISYSAGSTTITATAFQTYSPSDIQMTFSAKIQVTAAVTLTAVTYLQEGAVTSAMTYSPVKYISSTQTFAYSEKFESVSATSTVVVTVKLYSDTGQWTISSGQTNMNLVVFPSQLTAVYTPSYITSQICTADRTINKSNVSVIVVDPVTAKIFTVVKWVDVYNKWAVYKSEDAGITWSNTNCPESTSIYTQSVTVSSSGYFNGVLAVAGSIVHLAYQYPTTSAPTTNKKIAYNAYHIASDTWQYTSMLTINQTGTLTSTSYINLLATSNRVYLQIDASITYPSGYMCYTTDMFATNSTWRAMATNIYCGNWCLDNDGTSIHAIYHSASESSLLYKIWTESTSAWSTTALTLMTTAAASYQTWRDVKVDTASTVWAGDIFAESAVEKYRLFRKTAGATAFGTGWKTTIDNVVFCSMLLDSANNPTIYYISSGYTIYSQKFDVTTSAFNTAIVSTAALLPGDSYSGYLKATNYNGNLYMIYESGTAISTRKIAFHYNSNFQ